MDFSKMRAEFAPTMLTLKVLQNDKTSRFAPDPRYLASWYREDIEFNRRADAIVWGELNTVVKYMKERF